MSDMYRIPSGRDRVSKVVVVGIGGVGGYFGGLLARHCQGSIAMDTVEAAASGLYEDPGQAVRVAFVARGAHLQEIRANGLLLNTAERSGLVCRPAMATDELERLESPDLCLLCVKGYDLEEVSRRLAAIVRGTTVIMPLLNGVDIRERIRRHVKTGLVLPACVYVSASIERPGVVTQKGMAGLLICGRDPDHPKYDPSPVAKLFEGAGITVRLEKDAYPAIWEKYLFIASFGLVTAWADRSFGAVLEDPELRDLVRGIMEEIAEVAAQRGIEFETEIIGSSLKKAENFPYETKTSYQRDVEKRGRNEGDLFGGTIVRLGRDLGVPTPVTQRLFGEIEARLKAP
ncbi:MAG: 2-dehydropantoate 2-reductase [Spirochaetaceae bacterium]|nr:MAG: 2-dehydropantoate 2-reductase [Spirochaetaceae bacterium]